MQAYSQSLQRPAPGARPRSYKTECLVLRAHPMRDADRLVVVLAPSLGKLKLTVRGARKIASKLAGHLDVLNRARVAIAVGHAFDVVTGAESEETFAPVKSALPRLAEALYLMELADLLLPEADPHPASYRALVESLRALQDGREPAAVARHAELALLADAGFLPELRRCVACGADIEPERHRFAPALGGVVCGVCPGASAGTLPLSLSALKVLRHFAERSVAGAATLNVGSAVHAELQDALGASIRFVLERQPNAAAFVERLSR